MKALILDGSAQSDVALAIARESLEARLLDMQWEVVSYTLRDMVIAPCMGCFGCWVKTPGTCVIDDDGRNVACVASQSDLWFFLTHVTFGGYSSILKKAVDRMICLGLPLFIESNNEIHHPLRYGKGSSLIGIGLGEAHDVEGAEIFKRLIKRNAVNFQSPIHVSEVLHSQAIEGEIRRTMDGILSLVKV